jgi:uncharacterized protein (DUF1778 family)
MNDPIAEQASPVATDKSKLMVYLDPRYKALLEKLADAHSRSMSNFVEVLVKQAVDQALKDGVIKESD